MELGRKFSAVLPQDISQDADDGNGVDWGGWVRRKNARVFMASLVKLKRINERMDK